MYKNIINLRLLDIRHVRHPHLYKDDSDYNSGRLIPSTIYLT